MRPSLRLGYWLPSHPGSGLWISDLEVIKFRKRGFRKNNKTCEKTFFPNFIPDDIFTVVWRQTIIHMCDLCTVHSEKLHLIHRLFYRSWYLLITNRHWNCFLILCYEQKLKNFSLHCINFFQEFLISPFPRQTVFLWLDIWQMPPNTENFLFCFLFDNNWRAAWLYINGTMQC